MEYSKIFLSMTDFIDLSDKIAIQKNNEKKFKKNKKYNENQNSFYFVDYLESNKKNKFSQKTNLSQDRIYLLFFILFINLNI